MQILDSRPGDGAGRPPPRTRRRWRRRSRRPASELAVLDPAGPTRGTGLPAGGAAAASQPQTTVPARDFGSPGNLPVGPGHDKAGASTGCCYGDEDEPDSWLRAGEALSALWLTATRHGGVGGAAVAAWSRCPAPGRSCGNCSVGSATRTWCCGSGIADPAHAGPPHTPRLPAGAGGGHLRASVTSGPDDLVPCGHRGRVHHRTAWPPARQTPPQRTSDPVAGADPAVPGAAGRAAAGAAGPGRRGGDQPGAAARPCSTRWSASAPTWTCAAPCERIVRGRLPSWPAPATARSA